MGKLIDALKEGHDVNNKGYFSSYEKNIFTGQMRDNFKKMFERGMGKELKSNAKAVYSSSMLSYNFFHWIDDKHPFTWNEVEYTQVFFEVKMKTIRIKGDHPANMDVVLIGKDNKDKKYLLFIESKFTEYIDPETLSESYRDEEKWFNNEVKWLRIIEPFSTIDYNYKGGIKQLITHLFGIHGLISCDKSKRKITNDYVGEHCKSLKGFDFKPENMKFITLIFEPSEEDFTEEYTAYTNYHGLFTDFRGKIGKAEGGLKVVPEWVSYSDLWKEMKKQMPKSLKDYLWERYMKFAQQYD